MPANWRLLEAELIDILQRAYPNCIREFRGERVLQTAEVINLEAVARALADRVTLDSQAVQVKASEAVMKVQCESCDVWFPQPKVRSDYPLCDNCLEVAYDNQQQSLMENGAGPTLLEQQIAAMRYK